MNERLKRRKKGASKPSQEKAAPPEPLQPKYFEDVPEKPAREVETTPAVETVEARREPKQPQRIEPRAEQEPQPELEAQPESEAAEAEATEPSTSTQGTSTQPGLRPTRRRRRRGGRGGARRARAEAASQAPSAAPIATVSAAPDAGAPAQLASPPQVASPPQADALAAEPVAAELKPTVPATAPQRPSKGIVVLAIGLPGSGKTTWFKRHEIRPLSSDMMRTLLFDDVHEQRFQDLVFSNLRSMLKARLIARRPTNYVDATNLTPQERQHWIKLARDFNYEVHAVFFDVPLEVCIERHQRRDRVVPEDVMRRMAAKLKPPTFEEGFAKITVVRVKRKEETA